jgi:transcriptional regulator with XRE-family HTH domain
MNVRKLEALVNSNKLSKQEISNKCGFTRTTLNNAIRGTDVKISTIVSLSKFFNVPVGYFFDDAAGGNITNAGDGNQVVTHSGTVTISEYKKENAHLRALLEEKERTIQILMNKKT